MNFDHLVGQPVGSSVLLKKLDQGAMSVLFVVFQKTLKRRIAVKILPKSLLTPKMAEFFQQEALCLAAEIRKGTGDDSALADIMVEYVEKLGHQMALDSSGDPTDQGHSHLKKVIAEIESTLLRQVDRTRSSADALGRMERRLNSRLDSALDKIRFEWLKSQTDIDEKAKPKVLSVTQTLEYNVGDDEELSEVLKRVRQSGRGRNRRKRFSPNPCRNDQAKNTPARPE